MGNKRCDADCRSTLGSTEYQTVTSIRDKTVICFLKIFSRHPTVIVSWHTKILINLWGFTVDVAGCIARHVLGVKEDHCFLYKHQQVIAIGYQEVEVLKVADSIYHIKWCIWDVWPIESSSKCDSGGTQSQFLSKETFNIGCNHGREHGERRWFWQ